MVVLTMELRHLRYFVAARECGSLRAASRKLHVAQAAISQTLSNLELELGLALLKRAGGKAIELTPEGEVFYRESLKTLKQAEHAIELTRKTANGETGLLTIGFCGASTFAFLPDLIREYKEQYPEITVQLLELTPSNQEEAFRKGLIDVGFTRPLGLEFKASHDAMLLYRESLYAALPALRNTRSKTLKVADLAHERFILFHRKGAPQMFDAIISFCNENGFSPRIDSEPDLLQTALTLVSADQGVSIVPACALGLRTDGVTLHKLRPDSARIELVLAWPKQSHSMVRARFVDLVKNHREDILRKSTAFA